MKTLENDERVASIRLDIGNKVLALVMIYLCISVVVQMFFLNAPQSQYMPEFIGLVSAALIKTILMAREGILFGDGTDKVPYIDIKRLLISAAIFSAIFPIVTGIKDMLEIIVISVIYIVGYLSIELLLRTYNRRGQMMVDEDISKS